LRILRIFDADGSILEWLEALLDSFQYPALRKIEVRFQLTYAEANLEKLQTRQWRKSFWHIVEKGQIVVNLGCDDGVPAAERLGEEED
jgi:hypothetical protein